MPNVAVVTDSTAYLPLDVAAEQGIKVVPLHVVLGSWSGRESDEVSPADVAAALGERRVHVTTSRPTPGQLAAAYRATGARQIVSVHLSSALSGTADSAVAAAAHVAPDIEVRVVDSRSIGMGLGFHVLAAADEARRGGTLDEVEKAGREADTTALFYVDTLEFIRRGGRMTATSALVGAALAVKPLLVVKDGEIVLLEKVRTFARARSRLLELVIEAAGGRHVDVAVHHLAAPERAHALADELVTLLPDLGLLYVSEVGAVVGAHVGPGLLGVAVWRALIGYAGAAVVGYGLGAVNPAILIARARGIDLRSVGSGNPGASNAGRALGRKTGVLVAVLDVAKGAVPAAVFALGDHRWGLVAGLLAVLGHITSPFLKGKGGKGVATAAGAILGIHPLWVLVVLVTWLVVLGVSRWIALASICASLSVLVVALVTGHDIWWAAVIAVVVAGRHTGNVLRKVRKTSPQGPAEA